ncbi:hypothetical protein TRIATDRAFT_285878 [Trichoderma atroviride IMI 206040]|uniref:Protein kinase domain-containing protein n=1 Tax=Hypocrea atroviridis (strain ATCC 20476 / IMI 206040) TaxID=452589 RepID=G9P106_HYPAI|nr:uncharacterized protein TRIATDRAFT_285878 [Trichoderma atroviride IMI 206040]EHK43253.1 hypothetical protein TRIATDRAFT_285878 [Trichoderma atroviride IMI 206040]
MPSDASPAPLTQPSHRVKYITFSAANPIAIHLLEGVLHSSSAPQTLIGDKKSIGYHLQIPSLSDHHDTGDPTWQVGAGSIVKGAPRREPEILLCHPEESLGSDTARKSISPIHASLCFVESGALVLQTHCDERPIIYEQGGIYNTDVELRAKGREKCVMQHTQNFLRFGDYRFVLEFVTKDAGQVNSQAQSSNLGNGSHSLYYPIHYVTSYNIWLHPKQHTSRTSGVNIYTGEPVAVSTVQHDEMSKKARNLLRMACQYFHKPHKGVLGVIDVWCDHQRLGLSFVSGQMKSLDCCVQISCSTPLAKYNFRSMRWADVEYQQRLLYFYQTLIGLAELHQQILVQDAKDATPGKNHPPLIRAFLSLPIEPLEKHSTSVCTAPEMLTTGTDKADKFKADVWALAASWLFAFIRVPENVQMDHQAYRILRLSVESQASKGNIQEPFLGLLHQMLAWTPQDRPSIVEVLEHEVWQPFKEDRKRKRLEGVQDASVGSKRAKKYTKCGSSPWML